MLDEPYRKEIQHYVADWLEILPKLIKKGSSDRARKILKYKNTNDYFYGYFVGQMEGFALGFFQGVFNRHPDDDEHREIIEIIEECYKDLRNIIAQSLK